MNEELKQWLKTYLLDILCGMAFWGIVFAVSVGLALLFTTN